MCWTGIKSDDSGEPSGVWRVNGSLALVNVVGSQVTEVKGAAQDKKQEVF